MFQIVICKAAEEVIQVDDFPEIKTFIPGRQDILMHQQTEAIRRIVHAKSLELEKPFDINDSLLLSKCQQIAQQRSNTRIQAEALTNDTDIEDYDTTTIKTEATSKQIIQEEKVDMINNIQNLTKDEVKLPSDQVESQAENIDKIDHQMPPPPQVSNPMYDKPPLYYIYPQFVPEVSENVGKKVETTTSSTTQAPLNLYTEKMRFILKLPYPKTERLSNFPWEFDKYAYYPKHLQPDFVNMPMPYAPTYHMIRRLIIPSKVPGSYIVETNS